jgi:predicted nucleic acid-binding protein
VIAPQNIYEFYVVATRPISANGLGLLAKEALYQIIELKKVFDLLPDTPDVYENWEKLLNDFEINGKTAHDARLVAFMQSHQIKQLFTLNVADFQRFEEIVSLA